MSLTKKQAELLMTNADLDVSSWIHRIDGQLSIYANLGLSELNTSVCDLSNRKIADYNHDYRNFIEQNDLVEVFKSNKPYYDNLLLNQAIANALRQYYQNLDYSVQLKLNAKKNDYNITISWSNFNYSN